MLFLVSVRSCFVIMLFMVMSTSLLHGLDLAGKMFDISLMTGKEPQKTQLCFTATELSCKAFGKIPYTASQKKGSSAISFEATVTDAKGRTIVISGEVQRKEVHGAITLTTKDGAPTAINFTSVKLNEK